MRSSIRRTGPVALWVLHLSVAIAVLATALVDIGLSGDAPTRGLLLAAGCVVVALARVVLAPVEPADLRAERVDLLARPGREGAARLAPECPPHRVRRTGRLHDYQQGFAHL